MWNTPNNPLGGNFPPGFLQEYPKYAQFVNYVQGQFGGATQWNYQLFDALYRTSWVAERCVTVLADDACDKWRVFEHDDPEVVRIRTAYEEENEIASKMREALIAARLYGGSAIIPIIASQFNDEAFREEFSPITVKKDDLHGFQILTKFDFAPEGGINRDIFLNPRLFGDFIWYKIIRIQTMMSYGADQSTTQEPVNEVGLPTIHVSRMIKFFGKELLYYQKFFSGGWGDSILVPIIDKIPAIEEAFHLLYLYLDLFNIDEVQIPNLSAMVQKGDGAGTAQKWIQFRDKMRASKLRFTDKNDTLNRNQMSSIQNTLPIFQGLVQFVVGATGIPITRMLGTSVAGWGTGDNELTQYYDLVFQTQKKLAPQLKIIDECIERSLFGKKMDIKYRWLPKREMTEKERAEVNKIKADTFQIYLQNKVMTPKVVGENIQDDFNGVDEDFILSLDEDFLDYESGKDYVADEMGEEKETDAGQDEKDTSEA